MRKNWIWQLLLAGYILFLFSNSLTPASQSSAESGRVLSLVHLVLGRIGIAAPWLTEHVIRKLAHFLEYLVLGLLLSQSQRTWRGAGARVRELHRIGCLFIPFVDETLQLFTEGRSGQISDVWLDLSGVFAGSILFLCIFWAENSVRRNRQ